MGVPGWPEFACWTASIERVRIVFTHSSSSARWSVPTVIRLICIDYVPSNLSKPPRTLVPDLVVLAVAEPAGNAGARCGDMPLMDDAAVIARSHEQPAAFEAIFER